MINNTQNVKNVFSIKDLENLSGIKAHTIRIWEKRYNILHPMRSDTNFRMYDLCSLQKLLNITLLHNYGYKISKIATYEDAKIPELVKEIIYSKNAQSHAISDFKMAMINFDEELFFTTYNWLIEKKSFREIFYEVFLPLMHEIGLLWQTDTITPAQEHFITYLIKQKLLINIENLQIKKSTELDKIFVLSLPLNEIHELGLMYLHYEVLLKGYKAIYLGENVPIDSLVGVKKHFDNIIFVSYLTVQPDKDSVNNYVEEMNNKLLCKTTEIWYIGRMVEHIKEDKLNQKLHIFKSINELVEAI